ncbi:MAG TPA: DUF2279 domain-containing protein [Sphingomicrobium sp.]|nr:DUF2279 domain-containing protein [Sphingomicrobium sp.]
MLASAAPLAVAQEALADPLTPPPAIMAAAEPVPPAVEQFRLAEISAQPAMAGAMSIGMAGVAGELVEPVTGTSAVTEPYSAGVFWNHAKSIPWRLGGAFVAISATGAANWNWGSSPFRFQSEGWFGKDTHNGGMDKLGHAYTAFVLADFLTDGINNKWGESRSTSYSGALLSMGLMTYIEVFDGFSKDHGFSHEDLAMDAAGVLFSVARRSIPGLREKLDFRLLYQPSGSTIRALLDCFPRPHCDRNGQTFRSPITDYKSQRYLFALKLAGFEKLADTPLRLVELHGGYYARGFTREEEERGDPIRRRLFVGAGLNVSELLFPGRPRGFRKALKSVLEYLQVPYTAIHSK